MRNTYRVLLWKYQLKINLKIKQYKNKPVNDECENYWN